VTIRATYVLTAVTTALSLAVFSHPARADGGLYIGANAGKVLTTYRGVDIDRGLDAVGGAINSSTIYEDKLIWNADIGYMFNPYLGFEASFMELGRIRYRGSGTVTSDGSGVGFYQYTHSYGPAVAAIGVLPMTDFWKLDARVGVVEAKTISKTSLTAEGSTSTPSYGKTTSSLLLGVGTGISITSHWTVRMDFMRVQRLQDASLDQNFDVNLITAGVAYVF
jgi:opacity protein-like surface antigen